MKILIVPNAFKGSLTAREAGESIAKGFEQSDLDCTIVMIPIADGGDGSLDLLSGYLKADLYSLTVTGPIGERVVARYGWNAKSKIGVIELAEASGIRLLDRLDPWLATTFGTGELIAFLAHKDARDIYLTVGGSATVDGGLGILKALGVRFISGNETIDPKGPVDMQRIERIDLSELDDSVRGIRFHILTDVQNKLLGANGAVRVFGSQKGIKPEDMERFEQIMEHWSKLLNQHTDVDVTQLTGGGASGGVPCGVSVLGKVNLINGAEFLLEISGFQAELKSADLVITCEGRIDAQTEMGKGPGRVATYGQSLSKQVVGFCGSAAPDFKLQDSAFSNVIPINPDGMSLMEAMKSTKRNLISSAREFGNSFYSQIS